MVKLSCYLRFFITFAATARSVRSARARPNFFIFLFSAFVLSPFLSLVFSLLHFLATSLAAYTRLGEKTRSDYGFPLKWRRDSADLFPRTARARTGPEGCAPYPHSSEEQPPRPNALIELPSSRETDIAEADRPDLPARKSSGNN